jgi:hypothetical protein
MSKAQKLQASVARFNQSSKKVSAPVAMSKIVKAGRPAFRSTPDGDITVFHREYIMDVNGSIAFTTEGFLINPGNQILFPWLSNIAQTLRLSNSKSSTLTMILQPTPLVLA